jgi:sec-independent protein translocase protein TatB
MPSFSQDIILFILGLLLFGPKKLPVLARQIGKWMGEFRRASNEFKMQMEEELRVSEQADRQTKIAAMEAAAPATPALPVADGDPEDMHQRLPEPAIEDAEPKTEPVVERVDGVRPLPIAVSGELSIMPPATGLPVAQTASQANALDPLLESIPATESPSAESAAHSTEAAAHGR